MEIHDNDRDTLVAGFLSAWQMFSPSGDNDRGVLPNPLAVRGSSFEPAYEIIKLDGSCVKRMYRPRKGFVTAKAAKAEFLKNQPLRLVYLWPEYFDQKAPKPLWFTCRITV